MGFECFLRNEELNALPFIYANYSRVLESLACSNLRHTVYSSAISHILIPQSGLALLFAPKLRALKTVIHASILSRFGRIARQGAQ